MLSFTEKDQVDVEPALGERTHDLSIFTAHTELPPVQNEDSGEDSV